VHPPSAAELLNVVGFITGAVLYAMLLVQVLRAPADARGDGSPGLVDAHDRPDRLPLATAILGLIWNVGEVLLYVLPRTGSVHAAVALTAVSFPALGLLAAVVVHSVARPLPGGAYVTAVAYACSVAASLLHLRTVITGDPASTSLAFSLLTICFALIIVPLAFLTRTQPNGRRALWMLSLALFAVSASHLGRFHGRDSNWLVELAGHHAAIPLAFAILYQDYRFALADLFLKQALTLLALVTLAFGGYSAVAALPDQGPLSVGLLLTLWIATALIYPWLRRQIVRFVDQVLLGRSDFAELRATIARAALAEDRTEDVLDAVAVSLRQALSARRVSWTESTADTLGTRSTVSACAHVPTVDHPSYTLFVGELEAGRRLLSDDHALVEAVALIAGRRIDEIRLTSERFERRLREEEMRKLTAEAELRALRAQINPHFLFNALTTIGYLISAAPSRALDTLMRLTALLRGVLRSDGEFTTLGREIALVEHYLDIERERFEERLRVAIDVPEALRSLRVPSLIVQPLVENAVKHGIAPAIHGGDVHLAAARIEDPSGTRLRITVKNTGVPPSGVSHEASSGSVGLLNVERRLSGHFGAAADLRLQRLGAWTVAEIDVPIVEDGNEALAALAEIRR
jgi:hypothetical protein